MLIPALFLAVALSGTPNTAEVSYALPFADGTYFTELNGPRSAMFYQNTDNTYTVEVDDGLAETTVSLYPLPCFYVGATFLWKEDADSNGLSLLKNTYGVITVQGQGASFTLEVLSDKKTEAAFQPRTAKESEIGEEFCRRLGDMHHYPGMRVLQFLNTSN